MLDLFSGSGSLGCEALSRGAKYVVFIENDPLALKLIKKNISLIPVSSDRFLVIKQDLRKGLSQHILQSFADNPFDLVLADPPYNLGLSQMTLGFLDDSAILSQEVLVIVEELKGVVLNSSQLTTLQIIETRIYGDSAIHLYRREQPQNL